MERIKRVVCLLAVLTLPALAAAQEDGRELTLTCDGEVVGSVTMNAGGMDAVVGEDFACEGQLAVAEDPALFAEASQEDGEVTLTVRGLDGARDAVAERVPEAALAGMAESGENGAEAEAEGEAEGDSDAGADAEGEGEAEAEADLEAAREHASDAAEDGLDVAEDAVDGDGGDPEEEDGEEDDAEEGERSGKVDVDVDGEAGVETD